jgi:hypothetical protein
MKVPLKWCDIGDKDFDGYYLWFEKTGLIEVAVVEKGPPPNFNPPLTKIDTPMLIQVRELLSEPFSLFIHPPTMSRLSVMSSVVDPSIPFSSGTRGKPFKGIPEMSTFPSLNTIGPTPSMSFSIGPLIWGTSVVSSFTSIGIPSIPMPIPSILMPTYRSFSNGGSSLVFSMGGGNPSISTNSTSGVTLSSVVVTFGWNIFSVFGVFPSQDGGSSTSGGLNFPWVNTPFSGGPSLGGNFSQWGCFLFVNTSCPGVSSLGLILGIFFL